MLADVSVVVVLSLQRDIVDILSFVMNYEDYVVEVEDDSVSQEANDVFKTLVGNFEGFQTYL